ncbi:MAG: hypothetical protein AABY22_13320 [Nanoarchaeota archaeon]
MDEYEKILLERKFQKLEELIHVLTEKIDELIETLDNIDINEKEKIGDES